MSGTILRRRDRTARPPRVEHYSSAVNTSVDARHPTWFSRNVRHVCEGGFGWRGMYLDTAASETSKPSILSSPWIRGAPHNGFSRDIRRISPRNSLDTGGRPGFPRRDFRVQKRRKPFRCQPITVSGLTITRISLQPDHSRDRTTQKRRSAIRSDGLAPFRSKGGKLLSQGKVLKMQRRAAEESLTDHGKDNSNGRAHVGDAIRHKPGILGFLADRIYGSHRALGYP